MAERGCLSAGAVCDVHRLGKQRGYDDNITLDLSFPTMRVKICLNFRAISSSERAKRELDRGRL